MKKTGIFRMVRMLLLVAGVFAVAVPARAQIENGMRDEQGRHVIPRGFVMNTNMGDREVFFNEEDYVRLVRLGANFQVIRLELGRLSTFPGCALEPAYLDKLDELVRWGKQAGIRTVFKMTLYGLDDFSWEDFWRNKDGLQEKYLEAWKVIWERYKDESFVYGYDLVNEPRKMEMEISYDELTERYLIPVYQKLIDENNKINDRKMCLCQTIFMNKGEAINFNQYAEIKVPIDRPNVVFAPHIYQSRIEYIAPTMERFKKEAAILDAPILIGEWGYPTFDITDENMDGNAGQLKYMSTYIRTAEIFDQMGVGSIKAWFLGSRSKQNFLPNGPSTWAVFSDPKDVGTVERKYIMDIIARPYPQAIAGTIESFMFNHATRELTVTLKTDNSKGASHIFIGANRHYPDGFSVECGDSFILCHNPRKNVGLEVFKANKDSNPADFIWDAARQKLTILQWPVDQEELTLKIVPGINND